MPTISYIQPDNTRVSVDAEMGLSVMQIATMNDIDGIIAECGGNAMCATCHVYVESPLDQLPEMSDDEDALLYSASAERRPNSRLCCQIMTTDMLDGLVVRVPQAE